MSVLTKKAATPLPNRRPNKNIRRRAKALAFRVGRVWTSFEQFRTGGQSELATLGLGEIGQLRTRHGSFRILRDEDFLHLYGLARDVERVQGGLRVIIAAAHSAKAHRDDVTLEALVEAVAVCANFPTLPTRPAEGPIEIEVDADIEPDDLDGISLDPATVPRPFASRYAGE